MTSTTLDGVSAGRAAGRRPSLWRRALNGLIEARQMEARRHVNGYLLTLDDEALTALGYDRETLKKTVGISRVF